MLLVQASYVYVDMHIYLSILILIMYVRHMVGNGLPKFFVVVQLILSFLIFVLHYCTCMATAR